MRAIYEAESVVDACLVRDWLRDQGILAEVFGDELSGSFGLILGLVRVAVASPQWPEADAMLRTHLLPSEPPLPGRLLGGPDTLPAFA